MSPWYRFCRLTVRLLGRVVGGLTVEGLEHLPESGPFLLTSNHISLLDPPILGSVIPREVGFAAKKELFSVPILGPTIRSLNAIPLDRGRVEVATFRAFGRLLDEGKGLMYFPEGTRSKTGRFGKPKFGVGLLLEMYPVPVVPAYIEGTDSLFRCLIRRKRVRVVFGPAHTLPGEVDLPSESRRAEYRRKAEVVMSRIRALKEGTATTEDRETDSPADRAARPAEGGMAAPGRRNPKSKEGMEPTE